MHSNILLYLEENPSYKTKTKLMFSCLVKIERYYINRPSKSGHLCTLLPGGLKYRYVVRLNKLH